MKIGFYILLLLGFLSTNVYSQTSTDVEKEYQTLKRCGTDDYMKELFKDPAFLEDFERRQREINEKIKANNRVNCGGNPVIIPVAVHYGSEFNLSNTSCLIDKALEQIQVLNEDFGGYNFDITNYCEISDACPADYPPSAVTQGSCIQFCLGDMNHPAGEDVVGGYAITVGDYNGNSAPAWSGYCNFFVRDLGGGLLGVAPLSGAANPNGNGARVTSGAWGGPGGPCSSGSTLDNLSPYNLGRTATHELGHYFGLFHVFDGCGSGDGIDDTPPQSVENFGCPSVNTSNCTSTSNNSCGTPDFWFNFMDYVNDACMWMFTEDQSVKMYNTVGNFASGKCSFSGSYVPTYPDGCGPDVDPIDAYVFDFVDLACFADYSGSIFLEISGGALPYTIFIDGISYGDYWDTSVEVNNLPGGNLFIEITDAAGQYFSLNQFLDEPEELIIIIDSFTDLNCFEDDSGSIIADAIGGTPNYLFSIDGIIYQDNGIFENIGAFGYTVTVKDENNCESSTIQIIDQPTQISFITQNTDTVTCFGGNDGAIELLASGGIPSYTYQLTESGTSNATGQFGNLVAGEYPVEVEDENGCILLDTIVVVEPDSLFFTSIVTDEILCFGDSSATIMITPFGGTADYEYNIEGIGSNTSGEFENVQSGIFITTLTDANNCINIDTVLVTEPNILVLDTSSVINVNCGDNNDGVVNLVGSGGTPEYIYSIDNVDFQVSPTFTNLGADSYTFYIKDANGCQSEKVINVLQVSNLSISLENQVDAACLGDFSGVIDVNASNGAGALTFTLNGSSNNNTGLFENLTIGVYNITVEDENGCIDEIEIELTSTSTLGIDVVNKNDIVCFGQNDGQITLTGLQGQGDYSYSLDGVNFVDSNKFTDLSPGQYEVFVQDEAGCQMFTTVNIEEPLAIELTLNNKTDLLCNGDNSGAIDLSGIGGTGLLNFELNGDVNQTGIFSGLNADDYTINVSDDNGCMKSFNVSIEEPEAIEYTLSNEVASNCDGDPIGAFTITATGGSGDFTYTLDSETNSDGVFGGLSAGIYPVIITDLNNCSITENITVSSASDIDGMILGQVAPSCPDESNGTISIGADGGTGLLTYELNGVTNNTGIFTGLEDGEYLVNISDEAGCMVTVVVELQDPLPISANILTVEDANCFGEASGSINVDANGGTGNITFDLNGITNQTGTFENIEAGDYSILITDVNNCQTSIDITIGQPTEITSQISSTTDASCFGLSDGIVQVAASGGTGTLDFVYNQTSFADGIIDGLGAGDVNITIIDENGCEISTSATIQEPTEISVDLLNQENNPCNGDDFGSITVSASGGNQDYMFILGGVNNTSGEFMNLSAGNYELVVEDNLGCNTTYTFEITAPQELTAQISNQTVDNGSGNGGIQINVTGGTSPYTFEIAGSSATQSNGNFINLEAGDYVLNITDSEGCERTIDFMIELQDLPDDKNLLNPVTRPNPTDRYITLVFDSHGEQHIDLHLFSITGKFIKKYEYEATSGQNVTEIDFGADIPVGVYVLYLVGERKEYPLEIVIMK